MLLVHDKKLKSVTLSIIENENIFLFEDRSVALEMLLKTIFPMSSTLVYLERRRKAQTDISRYFDFCHALKIMLTAAKNGQLILCF